MILLMEVSDYRYQVISVESKSMIARSLLANIYLSHIEMQPEHLRPR
jgi:hypothetical protein